MRNAPESLKDIVDDIELMKLSLEYLERHRQSESHGTYLLDQCILKCRIHSGKINLLTEKISRKLDKASLAGRFYTAIRERDLDSLLSNLDRARSALHLAVNISHRAEEEKRWRMHEIDNERWQDRMTKCLVMQQALQDNQAFMMQQFEITIQLPRVHEVQEIDDNSE
jgi:hypothetical protein